MKYFKDENNQVYAFEIDGSQDAYIPDGLTRIPQLEADALRFPPPTIAELKAAKQAEIDEIEASQYMIRGTREAFLIQMLEAATAKGVTEAYLYSKNPFYKKTKDINDAVTALRAELNAIV